MAMQPSSSPSPRHPDATAPVDVLVIGAGPIGIASALECQRAGCSVRVVEKGAIVNSLVGYPTGLEFFSTPELIEIGGYPLTTAGYKPVRAEALDYYHRVAQAEALDLRLGERVLRVDGREGAFAIHTDKATHRARRVVVATGFFDCPNRLGVEGEDLPHVTHYYKEPYPYAGRRVVVVGAKNSAAQAALACYRHGAHVTLVHRGPALTDSIKYWIKPDLENRIRDGAIDARFDTTIERITPDAVHLATPDGPERLPADAVLAMTGYHPDFSFLRTLGIDLVGEEEAPDYDPGTMETNRAGLYVAGVVCGGRRTSRWFIENGRDHAKLIARHLSATEPAGAL
jgi:thioredoxin reductase (NADPH)